MAYNDVYWQERRNRFLNEQDQQANQNLDRFNREHLQKGSPGVFFDGLRECYFVGDPQTKLWRVATPEETEQYDKIRLGGE